MLSIRRRDFITLLGSAAAWPIAATGQQDRARRIGVLLNSAANDPQQQSYVTAFEQVLRSLGWRLGQNLEIEYRWSAGIPERSSAYATELAAQGPDLIVAVTTVSLSALLPAAKFIPIVFASVSDPVAQGFVPNLPHPGRNVTGFALYEFSIAGKWLDLLKQFAPAVTHVALMFNPLNSPQSKFFLDAIEVAASSFGVEVMALPVHQETEIEPAFATLARRPNGGLLIGTDNFLVRNRKQVVELAARHRVPAVYGNSDWVQAGGLMSYSTDEKESIRGAAFYVDRILKGAKPGDLPIQLASKFTLAVNLTAAQTLGLELPMSLMLRADEVIE
jgi:putative ABC transport system substrate-binding protein